MSHNCKRFVGKVAVLTGSTDGIGLAIARRLGQEGAKVVVSSRNIENVNRAVEELRKENIEVIGVKCHVSNKEERANLLQEAINNFGGIDLIVAAVGVNPFIGYITECPESAFDKIFQVNVKDSFLIAKEVIPHMKKRGGGSILFLSSIAVYKDTPLIGAYSSSKTAILGLTKAFSRAVVADNIRVNCLAAGITDTKFIARPMKVSEFYSAVKYDTPMKRIAQPDEMAGPAAFLLSDDASFITGEIVIAAGGTQSRL
ncbi:dehydrogenase/reductase SDR family member 4-like isoform X1 [Lutzomyia longipalpis]|uniref:dehydrogenase/reductase SDR family member 4-like isoform X1 n=2 Tax=Lutzomyia longipalpis TaxID=7200 RepID=UPI0024846EB3|nr:dehydrogenase/reductase SDR family member 4-like isoform X1 [Lutzomyia longipalpis]